MFECCHKYYDDVFAKAQYEIGRDFYYNWALGILKNHSSPCERGLDIGCGCGSFMLKSWLLGLNIDGIDFSPVAVDFTKNKIDKYPCNVYQESFYCFDKWSDYDYFICLETLEHLEKDIDLIKRLPIGKLFIGSVPNINDPSHVRIFKCLLEVDTRYKSLFVNFNSVSVGNGIWGFWGFTKGEQIPQGGHHA